MKNNNTKRKEGQEYLARNKRKELCTWFVASCLGTSF